MIERVYIETKTPLAEVQTALAGHGITAKKLLLKKGEFAADVPDSRDAEEEVTEALNDAGIEAYVYS